MIRALVSFPLRDSLPVLPEGRTCVSAPVFDLLARELHFFSTGDSRKGL